MNVLITGASGMLGAYIAKSLVGNYSVFATGNSEILNYPYGRYRPFNLNDIDYKSIIEWSNPDIIIHCGANTNSNLCQNDPLNALSVNGLSVRRLLDCTNLRVKIIYISTDAVFPSTLHNARESDCVNPESVYGKSKELGEFFLINCRRRFCIIRTTIVGLNELPNKRGFVEWIINSSKNSETISLFDDVIFNPISIWRIAIEINENIIANDITGIYHIAGSEICSKYQFGIQLLRSLRLPTVNIQRGSILQFSDRAKRSADQTLCTDLYSQIFKIKLPNLSETVLEIKKHYYEHNKTR